MNLNKISLEDYLEDLASSKPAPGGGSVVCLNGAQACSLISMVANLSIGKKSYKKFDEENKNIIEKSKSLSNLFIEIMNEDIENFKIASKAYSLPSNTDEEKIQKKISIEKSSILANKAPIKALRTISDCVPLLNRIIQTGTKLAISDIGISSSLLDSCITGCLLNIKINLKFIENKEYINNTCDLIRKAQEDQDELKSISQKVFSIIEQ